MTLARGIPTYVSASITVWISAEEGTIAHIFSEILMLTCPLMAILCWIGSVEGLSVDTVDRDGKCKILP